MSADPDTTAPAPDADAPAVERPAHWAPSVTAAAVVTDPAVIAEIAASIAAAQARELTPWWARLAAALTGRPAR